MSANHRFSNKTLAEDTAMALSRGATVERMLMPASMPPALEVRTVLELCRSRLSITAIADDQRLVKRLESILGPGGAMDRLEGR